MLLDLVLFISFVPGYPCTVVDEFFEVFSYYTEEFYPIKIFSLLIEDNITGIQPILNFLHILNRNRANLHKILIILHHKNHIKTLNIGVHSLKAYNLNLINRSHKEPIFYNIDQAACCWLEETVIVEGIAVEAGLTVWGLEFEFVANELLARFHECFELFVKFLPCLFLTLLVILVIVTIATTTSTNILSIGPTFRIKLHIL